MTLDASKMTTPQPGDGKEQDALIAKAVSQFRGVLEMRPEEPETLDSLRAQLAEVKAALGEHPDSELNLADRISELRDAARKPFHESTASMQEKEQLRQQLAEERTRREAAEEEAKENHAMWVHWQTEATKAAGENYENNRAANVYKNAFDVAIKQRDAALARVAELEKDKERALLAFIDSPEVWDLLTFSPLTLAHTGRGLRALGHDIPQKMEQECGYVLRMALRKIVEHGDKWREAMAAELSSPAQPAS